MSKHTPGPWTVEEHEDGLWIRNAACGRSAVIPFGGTPLERSEEIADANLIAAAPDLLEALEKIVVDEERRAKDLRHREAWLPLKFSEERIAKAHAAIAKATGDANENR